MERERKKECDALEAALGPVLARDGLSDIHIHVDEPLALRVHGRLLTLGERRFGEREVLAFADKYAPQRAAADAHDCAIQIRGRRLRAHFYLHAGRIASALRVLPAREPTPDEIGLPATVPSLLGRDGLVLVVGATGSGKSTTLAALIHSVHTSRAVHILTIEDPVEYPLAASDSLITRRELHRDTPSFAEALRAGLREDPDVILLGELRDTETARLALTAAETGHLLLTTLHAPDCAQALVRLLGLFPARERALAKLQLAQSLRLVIAQRLLPCAPRNGDAAPGRVAAFEVLVANRAVANLIREDKMFQIASVMQTARTEGMETMDAALARLRKQGRITEAA